MKYILLISSLLFTNLTYANYEFSWVHGDKKCPVASDSQKYIEVPVFHNLNEVAKVGNIPELNTYESLQEAYDGMKLKIFYEIMNEWSDNKELLILIPGGPGQTHADMHNIMDVFNEHTKKFTTKFNVIVMDHRGVGCSRPAFPGNEPHQSLFMRQAASDIDLIRKELVGDKKIHVWGYSYGSILAQTYALLYPGKVNRLFLGGAVSSYKDFNLAGTTYISNVFSSVEPRLTEEFIQLIEEKSDLKNNFLEWAFSYMYSYLGRTQIIPSKVNELISDLRESNSEVFLRKLTHEGNSNGWIIGWMMRSISCSELFPYKTYYKNEYLLWSFFKSCEEFEGQTEYFDYSNLISKIQVPTFIWGGMYDHVTPGPAMIKMAQKIPNSYIYIDPYLGHGTSEKRECFMKATDLFFSGANNNELEDLIRAKECSGLPKLAPIVEQ